MHSRDVRELREELAALRLEHRELDSKIGGLETAGAIDQLHITRLKKRKLQIKDKIASLEDRLFPDIIA
ncbi:MAG TPA: DUF465 domain-containing protein [Hyphomicrobiaceae bacterium]|nr:DUF465 domain-containing protein [Hyphomicrobiaceae bacterium]